MSRTRLLFQTLLYQWRTNLAVLLGVIAGTAVVGGALIVGDSVRGSLRAMTFARLGRIDFALSGPRFIREALADELVGSASFRQEFSAAAPAIILTATLEKPGSNGIDVLSRAGQVQLYGVDSRLWSLTDAGEIAPPEQEEILLSHRLAQQLNLGPGEEVILSVEFPSDIPRDSLLGKRDKTTVQMPLTVRGVLPESSGVARLGLRPDQQLPLNAFVSLGTLQDRLGLAARRASRKDPRELPARVNALFAAANSPITGQERTATAVTERLNDLLGQVWKLDDFHLRIAIDTTIPCLSLESERMILDRSVANAVQRVAQDLGLKVSPALVYIANEMSVVDQAGQPAAETSNGVPTYSRYAVVAGIDSELFTGADAAPFGPYVFTGAPPMPALSDGAIAQPDGIGEIILNDWLASDLRANAGDTIRLTYHVVGSHGELPEVERRFVVRGIVPLEGTIAADRGLTPEVRGITNVASFNDWDSPFEMKPVTKRDDAYWGKYRATPKAFVTLTTAHKLWSSRYGELTSIRIAPPAGNSPEKFQEELAERLLGQLRSEPLGLTFQPVKFQGLKAAAGTTDFGGLFFGFSFFLILSAAILIGLLFRLGIEQRTAQVGLLQAIGFSVVQVRRLLLGEALVSAVGGIGLGLVAACGYAAFMIHGLKTWWIGAIGTRFLDLYVVPSNLAMGAAISLAVAMGSIWWALRNLWRIPPRLLLAGESQPGDSGATGRRRGRRAGKSAIGLAAIAAMATAGAVSGVIPPTEAFGGFSWTTVAFFLIGMLLLLAGLSALSARIDADVGLAVRGRGLIGNGRLGMRNADRNRTRSLFSTGLIALATFLIVAIAAGHRNPALERPDRTSGNGGFALIADSSAPVLFDLNTAEGQKKLGLSPEDNEGERARGARDALGPVVGFRVNPGENASCLNIYQTSQPTILGVPAEMIARGGFKFVGAKEENPWQRLQHVDADGAIAVFGDMNTLQYSLHIGLGQTLELFDERHQPFKVRIAGMLDSSVFQGMLLMDDAPFRRLFPSQAGARLFLIETPLERADDVANWLESKLPGFDAERVTDRLTSFLAVQNTYLSTFQALGGLGLLLGTIGLSAVMLRNVLERRVELALLRAVGFRNAPLAWIVLSEMAFLLTWGLACGSAAALVAMLPHLLSIGADVPWRSVALLIGGVFAAGMASSLAAVRAALRTPVLSTLRGE